MFCTQFNIVPKTFQHSDNSYSSVRPVAEKVKSDVGISSIKVFFTAANVIEIII